MTDIVIPIKQLASGKQRLAEVLRPEHRAGLILAMVEDLLTAITQVDHGSIWLVSSDDAVFEVGRRYGAHPIQETFPRGYNDAITLAFEAVGPGKDVAVLPGDLPLATGIEIAELIAPVAHNQNTVRLAPSRDGLGTNGLFLSTVDLMKPEFGPASFRCHQRRARALDIEPAIIAAGGLAHDIDTPADLRDYMATTAIGATRRFLRTLPAPDTIFTFDKWAVA